MHELIPGASRFGRVRCITIFFAQFAMLETRYGVPAIYWDRAFNLIARVLDRQSI
jgi:hypothetical protein